ncbi:MAG TPA: lytic transglycosylase domain-containing protein [Rudaea sp.]|jgi:hypothetical protein|uniref:lytic transglycosylase domain-containing protein n=1 Tax=Rudaea sp. TaxID=2136325 RepID=UPI002F94B960
MKNLPFAVSAVLPVLALCLGVLAPRAHAGAVYRCAGANGQTAYTNKPAGLSGCTKISEYIDPPKPPALKPAEKSTPSNTVKPVAIRSAQSEYKSEPASQFANVVSGISVRGVEQKSRAAQNPTVKVDKSTEVRRGSVYKVARANGITEYTNIKPAGGSYQLLFTYIATCYACNVHSAIDFATIALNLGAYRDEIAAASAEFGVEPSLLRAVIHAESAFNPNAISDKGAQGLMQLMPATAADLGVGSPFDVGQNIRGGAHYLALLLRQFNGDERLATAAYNAGPQNVQKYNGIPPFDETKVYVERVATLRKRYRAAQ